MYVFTFSMNKTMREIYPTILYGIKATNPFLHLRPSSGRELQPLLLH